MSMLPIAASLVSSTPGEAARQVMQSCAEQVRQYTEVVLQETIRLSLEQYLGPHRQRGGDESTLPWSCEHCGPRLASQVMRNGTYKRSPLTRQGPVSLRIPQILCRDCGHSIPYSLPCLPRFRRLWLDVEHELVRAYLAGHSYRTVASQVVAGGMSLMTAWRSVQRTAAEPHEPPPTPELKAIGVDEMHIRIKGRPHWYLTARGATADGKSHYLGAVLSEDRSQAAWEKAMDGLGLLSFDPSLPLIADGDAAIEAAVSQCLPGRHIKRCAWHVLHNVNQWLRERLPGEENEGLRRGLMAGAQSVVNAGTATVRQESLALLAEEAPWLVAALEPALSRVGYPGEASPRTNNVCERGFREYRRRIRPMDGFGSTSGAKNFGILWMLKENARARGLDWMEAIMP